MNLNVVRKIDNLIRVKELEQVDLINSFLRSPVTSPDKIQTSITNTTEEKNIKIAELGAEINEQIKQLIEEKKKLSKLIDQLENPDEITVLNLRYVQLKSYEEIAEFIPCSLQNVYRIRKKAIKSLKKIKNEVK